MRRLCFTKELASSFWGRARDLRPRRTIRIWENKTRRRAAGAEPVSKTHTVARRLLRALFLSVRLGAVVRALGFTGDFSVERSLVGGVQVDHEGEA